MSDVLPTFGIVAFMRPAKLARLIRSILDHYPSAKIVVADNGRRLPARPIELAVDFHCADVHVLPFDCGLSASRNFLVAHTTGDLLILDDDYVFTAKTRIDKLQHVSRHDPSIGIVCGNAGFTSPMNFAGGRTEPAGHHTIRTDEGTDYMLCDMSDNFMLVRREVFDDGIRWDGELKTGEHRDFFEKVHRSPWKVAYCESVTVDHDRTDDTPEYQRHRSRCCTFHRAKKIRQRGLDGQRVIAVVGPFRGGTSCVAGMLHKMGVSMGDDFRPPKTANPRGFFESESLGNICRQSFPEPWLKELTDAKWRVDRLREWAAIRNRGIFGAKHPTLCLMVPDMLAAWPDLRIVSVQRPVTEVQRSLTDLGWGWPAEAVEQQVPRMVRERNAYLTAVPHLEIPYRFCVERPDKASVLLADFAGVSPTSEQLADAAAHVDRSLDHWSVPA